MASSSPVVIPANVLRHLRKSDHLLKEIKKVDPRNRYVALFPDQRNIHIGMGIDLLNTKCSERVYEQANELTKINVMKLCMKGPQEELKKSLENQFIATYVTSHAAMQKFSLERPHDVEVCRGSGGVGIGILNSLVFSGALSFENGLDLARRFGQSMDRAAEIVPNSKLIIRMKPATSKSKLCQAAIEHCLSVGIPQEIAVCSIVAQIRSNLIVVGGHEEAIRFLEQEGYRLFDFWEMRRDKNDKLAYFSPLMQPAALFMKTYIDQKLDESEDFVKDPGNCRVYSTIRGGAVNRRKDIIRDLYNFPVVGLKIEHMLQSIYRRASNQYQPNTVVFWDKYLLKTMQKVNRKAWTQAKLFQA